MALLIFCLQFSSAVYFLHLRIIHHILFASSFDLGLQGTLKILDHVLIAIFMGYAKLSLKHEVELRMGSDIRPTSLV